MKSLVATRSHLEIIALEFLITFSSGSQRVERQREILRPRRFETIGRRPDEDVSSGVAPPQLDSFLCPNLPVSINGLHDYAIRAGGCRFPIFQLDPQLYESCAGVYNRPIRLDDASDARRQRKENDLIFRRLRVGLLPR